ncbi:MAG: hypothetical protein AAF497_20125 [Planctomycetota bacterium]
MSRKKLSERFFGVTPFHVTTNLSAEEAVQKMQHLVPSKIVSLFSKGVIQKVTPQHVILGNNYLGCHYLFYGQFEAANGKTFLQGEIWYGPRWSRWIFFGIYAIIACFAVLISAMAITSEPTKSLSGLCVAAGLLIVPLAAQIAYASMLHSFGAKDLENLKHLLTSVLQGKDVCE